MRSGQSALSFGSKPEVIQKRTLDRIGGFQPAKRDVVQKSASGRSLLISSKPVSAKSPRSKTNTSASKKTLRPVVLVERVSPRGESRVFRAVLSAQACTRMSALTTALCSPRLLERMQARRIKNERSMYCVTHAGSAHQPEHKSATEPRPIRPQGSDREEREK